MTARFLIDATGPDMNALDAALEWLRAAVDGDEYSHGVIVVDQQSQLDDLSSFIPATAIRELKKGNTVRYKGVGLRAATVGRGSLGKIDVPVLGLWMDSKQLEKIEASQPPGICALTWTPSDAQVWKENHNPHDPRTTVSTSERTLTLSPIVLAALSYLPHPSSGLTHPNDKAKVVDLFRVLVKNRQTYEPSDVRIWAVRQGWTDADARSIEDYATRVLQGQQVKAAKWWPKETFKQWCDEAS